MKIALFCPSFGEYGGIGRIAAALAAEFTRGGHGVAFVYRDGAKVPQRWASSPALALPCHQMPRRWTHVARLARFGHGLAGALPRLRAFVRAEADIVLTLAISTYAPWALGIVGVRPIVVSLQGGEPDGRFASHRRLFRRLLRGADRVTACASSLATEARRLAPDLGDRVCVVPNGVDVTAFGAATTERASRSHPYVLAAGRFTRQKGFDVLLDAAARLDAVRSGGLEIVLAGDGPEEPALRQQAERLGIGARIVFVGALETDALRALYAGARVVAVPSRWEGLPLVCLEAMASRRPVVATNVDGIPDAVVHDETGCLVPPDDAVSLADALDRILRDPEYAERLGTAGAARATAHFAWPVVAANYVAVFERALHAARP